MKTASQFIWSIVGGYDFEPKNKKYAKSDTCWLCGGDMVNGWVLRDAISKTVTNHNQAKCQTSDGVCQSCVAMSKKDTYSPYVAANPEMGLKDGKPMAWQFYSHFAKHGHHECPKRDRHRELLLDPPEPPFLHVIATSGKKHIIFRSEVAYNRDVYPVQFEEDTVIFDRAKFAKLLEDFEEGLNKGISRNDLLSGQYHPATRKHLSLNEWRKIEDKIKAWRCSEPMLMQIANFVAQKDKV